MELNPEESSVLGLVARFSKLTRARKELEELVGSLRPPVRNIGLILLGEDVAAAKPDERQTAKAYEEGREANRRIASRRRAVAGPRRGSSSAAAKKWDVGVDSIHQTDKDSSRRLIRANRLPAD